MIHNMVRHHQGITCFCGIGERSREEKIFIGHAKRGSFWTRTLMSRSDEQPPGCPGIQGSHAVLTMREYF